MLSEVQRWMDKRLDSTSSFTVVYFRSGSNLLRCLDDDRLIPLSPGFLSGAKVIFDLCFYNQDTYTLYNNIGIHLQGARMRRLRECGIRDLKNAELETLGVGRESHVQL
jgi:hypothetical protein